VRLYGSKSASDTALKYIAIMLCSRPTAPAESHTDGQWQTLLMLLACSQSLQWVSYMIWAYILKCALWEQASNIS